MPNCGTLPDFGNFRVSATENYDRYKGVAELMPFAKAVSAKSHDFDADGNETQIDYKQDDEDRRRRRLPRLGGHRVRRGDAFRARRNPGDQEAVGTGSGRNVGLSAGRMAGCGFQLECERPKLPNLEGRAPTLPSRRGLFRFGSLLSVCATRAARGYIGYEFLFFSFAAFERDTWEMGKSPLPNLLGTASDAPIRSSTA